MGKFRRPLDLACQYFTVTNFHVNNECAKRMSVCIALMLLARGLCLRLGKILLTGDFNKDAERELRSSGTEDQRRVSPMEPTFDHAATPPKSQVA